MTDVEPGTLVALVVVTLIAGIVLGFIGAGGAGLLLGILAGPFGLAIDEAIGTALAAMCFVTVFGAVSHHREGNVSTRIGMIVGVSGMAGAAAGAVLSQDVPADVLRIGAGLALWSLAVLMFIRTRVMTELGSEVISGSPRKATRGTGVAVGLGSTGGIAAGFFGVGMAPYLQLGFLTLFGLTLRQTVGTTMWALTFISAAGALVLAGFGDLSVPHLVAAVIGLSAGSFTGAKLTARVPLRVLRGAVVVVPITAGTLVLFS